ncbi:TonB-dependent receptor [Pelagicoccus sp. SDUM812005]|uniref:TonB-dependent receptor plug domain-containing protein n=1 Tax=Pelagicoccus sp. SDUM812005 TaxID=3041257 RepID=UPI0028108989|nr:TonB-dependent receptor [Pelagicoccus sp. SDUM812005]MDQ8183618.1 TonB-dependent receptor [Pelagicoccus sp. SDUM812005]
MSPIRNLLAGASLSLSVASVATTSAKQAADLFELSLDELLEIEVVSASISPKKLNSTPGSVTVFTAGEIQNLGVSSLEELVNFAPGYQSAKRGDSSLGTPYSARGRAIGTSTTEVIVLLDGRRIDNAVSGGQSTSIPSLSLANIETVEFLRGPASALYGSNAFLGVINLTSRRQRNDLRISYGSHQTIAAEANFSQSNRHGLAIDVHARREESHGEKLRVYDTFAQSEASARAPYQKLDLDLRLSSERSALSLLHTDRESDAYLVLGNLSPQYNQSRNQFSQLAFTHSLEHDALASLDLSGGIKRRQFTIQAQTSPIGALAPISQPSSDTPVLLRADVVEYEPWLKLDGSYRSSASYDIVFGIEYRSPELEPSPLLANYDLNALAQSQFPVTYFAGEFRPTGPTTKQSDDIFGAYFQFENRFDDDTLTLGLRYDTFSYASSRLSPRIAYVHPLFDTAFLKLIWGESYRAPALSERSVSTNNLQVGNPSLKPETVTTTELVFGGNWSELYASVSLFENTFRDSIVQAFVNDLRTFQNAPQESSSGLEAEMILQLGEQTKLRLSATHFFDLPQSSFRDSRSLAALSINQSSDRWNFNASALYHSSQRTPTPDPSQLQKLPAYWTANAKLSYQIATGHTASLRLTNAFDEEYYTASQSIILGGVPNPGRSLSLDYSFEW